MFIATRWTMSNLANRDTLVVSARPEFDLIPASEVVRKIAIDRLVIIFARLLLPLVFKLRDTLDVEHIDHVLAILICLERQGRITWSRRGLERKSIGVRKDEG